jgi:hypothetical protein
MKLTAQEHEEILRYAEKEVERIIEELARRLEEEAKRLRAKYGAAADPMGRRPDRKRLATVMAREIDVLAAQLRKQGVANPITQARDRLAQRCGFASGQSLHRWLRRNR